MEDGGYCRSLQGSYGRYPRVRRGGSHLRTYVRVVRAALQHTIYITYVVCGVVAARLAIDHDGERTSTLSA